MTPVDEFIRRSIDGRPEPPPTRWETNADPDNPRGAALAAFDDTLPMTKDRT